jgi:hypothetical protein
MSTDVLGNALVPVRATLDKLDKDLSQARGKVDSSTREMAASMARKFAAGAAVAGGAAATALSVAWVKNASIEAGNDKLAAQLGLTAEQSEAFGEAAGNLYSQAYGDSLEQVNAALDSVQSSLADSLGPAEDALERTTAKALNLADAFGVEVADSSKIAGIAVNTGLARDADHAFDLITASMQRMPAGMRQELIPMVEEYAVHLSAMGITGEDAFGLMVAASQNGAFAIDKQVDAIKELAIRATDMSTTSVDAYKAVGLEADDMAARFVAGGADARGALNDLIDGLLGIEDPVERSNAAIALFGTPLEDLSVTQIPQFLTQLRGAESGLGDVAGAADEMGDTLSDNAQTDITAWQRTVEMGVVDLMNDKVIPAIEGAPGPLSQLGKGLLGAGMAGGGMAGELGMAAVSLKSLGGPLGKLGSPLAKAARGFGTLSVASLKAGFNVVRSGVMMAASAVRTGAKVAAQVALQVARWIFLGVQALLNAAKVALAWLISLGPIALVGAAVIALVALIVLNWDKVTAAFAAAFDWLKRNWPLVLAILTGPIGLAVLAIVRNWDTIKAKGAAALQWIRDKATGAKDWLVAKFNAVVDFFTGLPGRIARAGRGMWDFVADTFKTAVNRVIGFWNDLEFTIGGGTYDPLGRFGPSVSVPSFTFRTPNLPTLWAGGNVTRGGLALTSELGPELLALPSGASVTPLGGGGGRGIGRLLGGGGTEVVQLVVDGRVLAEVVVDHQDDKDRRNGRGRGGRGGGRRGFAGVS